MSSPPQAVILAGPNGAGKTTSAKSLLPTDVTYVNADIIAQRLSGQHDAPGGVEAMRIELAEVERLLNARESFALETTLAPKSLEKRINGWQAAGYEVVLIFMSLPEPELSIERVRARVLQGGHHVPDEVVRRRFKEGLRNFFQRYRALVDYWYLYDNLQVPRLIASGTKGQGEKVDDFPRWTKLEERYRQ